MQQVRTHAASLVQLVLFRVVFRFSLLFFEGFHKKVNALLKFLLVAGHEEMVETDPGVSPNSILDCGPVAVTLLVGHAQKHNVCFLAEVL